MLESITFLEAFVHNKVFAVLEETMDPRFVKWLKKKTSSEFDTRLGILTPLALGRPIDTNSKLWNRYMNAKGTRNKVTHSGAKISYEDAKQVYDTVYEWLAYLGSTVDIDLALLEFKQRVESEIFKIFSESDAIEAVGTFFAAKKGVTATPEKRCRTFTLDLVLSFGSYTVAVEGIFIEGGIPEIERRMPTLLSRLNGSLDTTGISRGALIVFSRDGLPDSLETVQRVNDGRISKIGITLPSTIQGSGG